MFDSLTQSFQRVFKNVRGHGKLSDRNIKDALREVRMALLEADVNYKVVKDFIGHVREKVTGEEVLNSIHPGQQFVKRVHEELIHLLQQNHQPLSLKGHPAVIMLLGLHGAGKTTTASKLAKRFQKDGRSVLLAACDIRRPAAVDQLQILADQIDVPLVRPQPGEKVPDIGARSLQKAQSQGANVLILDTGGRFQIDSDLVSELQALKQAVNPREVILVVDAAIGQESVHVAETFNEKIGLTGLILTKLDGDARGGAALSVQSVTGCPIYMVGMGEKEDDLEPFYPDRMASRILGMGDVVSLVEKAQEHIDVEEAAQLQEQLNKKRMDLEDFLKQIRQVKKMGSMSSLMEMMPGLNSISADQRQTMMESSDREMKRTEAIIQSMTPYERRHPNLINGRRRARIAGGSGTRVSDVNELLKRFKQSRKMMKKMKFAKRKGLPRMPF